MKIALRIMQRHIRNKHIYKLKCRVGDDTAFILEGLANYHGMALGNYLETVVEEKILPCGNHMLYQHVTNLVHSEMMGIKKDDYREDLKTVLMFASTTHSLNKYALKGLMPHYSEETNLLPVALLANQFNTINELVSFDTPDGCLKSPRDIIESIRSNWNLVSSIPETYDLIFELLMLGEGGAPVSLWTVILYSNYVYNRSK